MGGMVDTVAEMEFDMFPYLNAKTVPSGEMPSVKPTSSYCSLEDYMLPHQSSPFRGLNNGYYKYQGIGIQHYGNSRSSGLAGGGS